MDSNCIKLPRDRNGEVIHLGDHVRSPFWREIDGEVSGLLLRDEFDLPRIHVHYGCCDAYLYPMDLEHVEGE